MKRLTVSIALLLCVSVLLALSACAKKQSTLSDVKPAAAAKQEAAPAKAEKAAPAVKTEAAPAVKSAALSEIDTFQSEKIFFDFDNYDLKPEARKVLEKKAAWLQAHPEISIRIEGHCDERGTTEYNLALGQRRAEAALSYLASLGIAKNRIATVSYGELEPAAPGHDEKSWSQNRRDEFKVDK